MRARAAAGERQRARSALYGRAVAGRGRPRASLAITAERYRRALEPAVRGVAGIAVTVALFAAGAAAGGRAGTAVAGAWITVAGLYCAANFAHCRETHCAVTGPGWTLAGLLGLAAAVTPGAALSWYRENQAAAAFLVILAAGYGLEWVVAARTGRRALPRGDADAEDQ